MGSLLFEKLKYQKLNFRSPLNYIQMKNLTSILTMCIAISAFAQNSFPTSNAIWNVRVQWWNIHGEYDFWENIVKNKIFKMEGDTLIEGVLYSQLLYDGLFFGEIKQENEKVWLYDCLLYDFGASIGDTVWHNMSLSNAQIDPIPFYDDMSYSIINDIRIINGIKHLYTNSFSSNGFGNGIWIEGMGSYFGGPFGHLPIWHCLCENTYSYDLGCFMHNDTIKYLSNVCNSCFDCPFYFPINVYGIYIIVNDNGWPYPTDYYFPYSEKPIQISLNVSTIVPDWLLLGPITYHWSTNSQTYVIEDSTILNPIFSFLGDVSVYLKVTDKLGYSAYDTVNLIMQPQYVREVEVSKQIFIFPNPTKDILNIELQENIEIKSISIYSIDGKLVEKNRYSFKLNRLDVNCLEVSSYVLCIETNRGNFNQIIIKN